MTATGATSTPPVNVSERKEIARLLLDAGTEAIDLELEPVIDQEAGLLAALSIPFPDGLAPSRSRSTRRPTERAAAAGRRGGGHLDRGGAERAGRRAHPGHPRSQWYRYTHHYEDKYLPQIRDDAPARKAQRMASYFPTKIGNKTVLCMKSELHLNQDGIATGTAPPRCR